MMRHRKSESARRERIVMNDRDLPDPAKRPAGVIGFCTACCNRLHQLTEVFDANIEALRDNADITWTLLDYGSNDGLRHFVFERLDYAPPRFTYVAPILAVSGWHGSIAKNLAHRESNAEIIMNLDADNRIGDAAQVIRNYFHQGCEVLHMWSGVYPDGTYGRIALLKVIFDELGGYDEAFYPMGFHDTDLLLRARALGYTVLWAPSHSTMAQINTKDDSVVNCRTDGLAWRDFNEINKESSARNIEQRKLIANLNSSIVGFDCLRLNGRAADGRRPN